MNGSRKLTLNAVVFFTALCVINIQWARAESPIEAAELLKQYKLSETTVSPDGQRVAVVVTEPVEGDQEHSSIWLYEHTSERFRQLTTAGIKDSSPRWAPNGQTLGYLSVREGQERKAQIFLLPMSGGEGERLTNTDAVISVFEWSPDGKSIAYLAQDEAKKPAPEGAAGKDDARVVSEDYKANILWRIELESRDVRQVLAVNDWSVSEFAWLPDGEQLVVAANNARNLEILADELYVVEWDDGEMRGLGKPEGPISDLRVAPDGKTLAYIGVSDGGPSPHDVYLQAVAGGSPRNLTASGIDRSISSFTWLRRDALLILVDEGFGSTLVQMKTTGAVTQRKNFSEQLLWDVAQQGALRASIRSAAISPPELWITDGNTQRQVSALHPGFPELIAPEIIRYTSADGMKIEAALFLPAAPRKSPLPLITLVHGGPAARWSNRINDWAQLLSARGYAVFAPNIRGSVGYGLSFVRSNRRDWGGGDFRDVMAGIDSLIERGIADPDRLGIGGWSYGGYMSAWAITQTRRFKVAVIGAPMTDLAAEYGTEKADINAYDTWYLGTPYENLDDFIRMSPMTHVKNARTPSLILVGEDDPVDPVAQCWQFHRGLRRYGVEVEMVIYPRELHRIKEELHALDVLQRMTLWFERFLH